MHDQCKTIIKINARDPMTLQKVCATTDIPLGEMKPFKIEGEKLLIYHTKEGFYATQTNCTHMFVPLKAGKLDDCTVQCPFHRARFDVRTGEVIDWASFPPGVQLLNFVRSKKSLKTYPISTEDGHLFVEVA